MLLSLNMGLLKSMVVVYLLSAEEIIIILSFVGVNFVLDTIGKFFINTTSFNPHLTYP